MEDSRRLQLKQVHDGLSKCLRFLQPYLSLANAHAIDFIINDYWNNLLPPTVQDELQLLTNTQLLLLPCLEDALIFELKSASHSSSYHSAVFVDETNEKYIKCCSKDKILQCNISKSKLTSSVNDDEVLCNNKHCTDILDMNRCTTEKSCTKYVSENQGTGTMDKGNKQEFGSRDENSYQRPVNTFSNTSEIPEIVHLSVNQRTTCVWSHSNLLDFCLAAKECMIDESGLAIGVDELLRLMGYSCKEAFVGTFMGQKKSHEVQVMSNVCAAIARASNCELIIDFGSGKGYLGQQLALQHGISVLGIDSAAVNTKSAGRRKRILERQWGSLSRNVRLQAVRNKKPTAREKKAMKLMQNACKTDHVDESCGQLAAMKVEEIDHTGPKADTVCYLESCDLRHIICNNSQSTRANYVPCTMYVDNETDVVELVKLNFPEMFSIKNTHKPKVQHSGMQPCFNCSDKIEPCCCMKSGNPNLCAIELTESVDLVYTENSQNTNMNLMLTGLHTCGTLASTSLDLFVNNYCLKSICNIGCCYHWLDEEFHNESNSRTDPVTYGFPKSEYLRSRNMSLGRTARTLASQSVDRNLQKGQLQGESFFPRALLEVIIHEICGKESVTRKRLRNLEQNCGSTQKYIREACDQLGISHKVTDETIDMYLNKYADSQHKLAAFFQLRTILAPCIETVITLDRVCFLLEQASVQQVFLVKMFDPVISPRCYGIVAIKCSSQ